MMGIWKKRSIKWICLVITLFLFASAVPWGVQESSGVQAKEQSVVQKMGGSPESSVNWTMNLSSEISSSQLPGTIKAGETLKLSCRLYGLDTQVQNPWRHEEGYQLWSDEDSWEVLGSRFLAYPDYLYSLEGAPAKGGGEMPAIGEDPTLAIQPAGLDLLPAQRPDYGGLLEIELRARVNSPAGLRLTTESASPSGGLDLGVSSGMNLNDRPAPAGSRTLAEVGTSDSALQTLLDLNATLKPPARVGTFKPLVVMVDFPDNTANVSSTRGFYQNLLFATSGISMTTFFLENSWNRLDLQGNVVWNQAGTAWVRTTTSYTWYVNNQQGLGSYPQNTQRLTEDILTLIDPYVNFSDYDSNGDGEIDGLMVIYAGQYGGSTRIWPHQWSINSQTRDGIQISDYCMQPEYNSAPLDTGISVYLHEYSHILGAYDLYDYDYTSAGVGLWSLMAWDNKQHVDPWSKSLLGWITPTIQSSNATSLLIPAVETTKLVYRLNLGDPSEYYLLENRANLGYDQNLPGWGVLIWHIDEDAISSGRINDNEWYPPDQLEAGHYTVALEQADGLYELEKYINGGNVGDPFTSGSSFTPITNPSSCDYTGFNWNVQLTNFSASGSSTTADFSFNLNYPVITWWPLRTLFFLLQGSANPGGQNTQAWFEWGTTTAYGSTTSPVNLGSGTIPQTFTATIPAPAVITDYHFRAVCQNASGTFYGEDKTFTTSLGEGQWKQLPLYGGLIYSLVIDPSNSQTLYAATEGGGIWKSADSGASWAASSGEYLKYERCLVIDPSNTQTLYAGTMWNGIWKSTNGGAGWNLSFYEYANRAICSLVIDPANPQILYAGTVSGICKSSDGGANWVASSSGLPNSEPNSIVWSLAITPSNSQILYAGTQGGEVFKSSDGGTNWVPSSSGLMSGAVYSLNIDPSNSQTLYAGTSGGVFKSINGGISWTASSNGLMNSNVWSLVIDRSNPETLFACTGGGVFKSSDKGGSWTISSSGLMNSEVHSLSIDRNNPQTLYAGTGGAGVFKSSDSGINWIVSSNGLTSSEVRSLAIDPTNSQTLYAGTQGGGVQKSSDSGMNWLVSSSGLMNNIVPALAIDPVNSKNLYAGTWGGGVWKSSDSGANWIATASGLTNGWVWCLAIDRNNPQTLYAGGLADGLGMWKSSDGGINWTASSTGLPNNSVYCLAIDPINTQTLYAGFSWNGGGVWKSSDGGANWTASSTGLASSDVMSLAIDPVNPQTLYAAPRSGGVCKSNDGGANWTRSSTGLCTGYAQSLAIAPSNPKILYAGTETMGVWKSSDGGANWTISSNGLTNSSVYCLAIDPSNPQALYAGTFGGGVYKYIPSSASSLSLLSPNGGEQWGIGSTQTITWTPQGVSGNIKIEINRSYPSGTWETLFASLPNDGTELWVVTTPDSTTCRMRISSVSDPAIQDISDGNFAIDGPPAPLAINSILATPNSEVSNWNPVTIQASANRSGSWSGTIHHPSGAQIGTLAGGSGSAYIASWAPSAAQNFCGNGFYAVVQVTADGEIQTAIVSFTVENFQTKALPVSFVDELFQPIANPKAGQAFHVVISMRNNSSGALSSAFALLTVGNRYIGAGGYQDLQPGQQISSTVSCEGLAAGSHTARVYVWVSLGGYALAQPLDFLLTVLP